MAEGFNDRETYDYQRALRRHPSSAENPMSMPSTRSELMPGHVYGPFPPNPSTYQQSLMPYGCDVSNYNLPSSHPGPAPYSPFPNEVARCGPAGNFSAQAYSAQSPQLLPQGSRTNMYHSQDNAMSGNPDFSVSQPADNYLPTQRNVPSSMPDQQVLGLGPTVGPSHRVVRNHICPTCGKGFGRPSSLAQHEFTHTGERPFVCPVCTKAFNTSSNLKRHQSLHQEN